MTTVALLPTQATAPNEIVCDVHGIPALRLSETRQQPWLPGPAIRATLYFEEAQP